MSIVPDNSEPNDPRVFRRLTDALAKLHTARGKVMYFISRDDVDDKEARSFTNNYPSNPTELYGLGDGVMDADDLEKHAMREDPHVTIAEAGTMARAEAEDEQGCRLAVNTWLLNLERQQQHGRIAEIAVSEVADDPEISGGCYDADIFWLEADGRAWCRPFFDSVPRQRVSNTQLEWLALLMEGSVG